MSLVKTPIPSVMAAIRDIDRAIAQMKEFKIVLQAAHKDAVTRFNDGTLSAGEVVDMVAKREAEVMMNAFLTEAEPELVEAFEAQATR